jgi:hypothetical protein
MSRGTDATLLGPIDASKVATGTFAPARIPTLSRGTVTNATTFEAGWRQPANTYRPRLRFWRDVYGVWHVTGMFENSTTYAGNAENSQIVCGTLPSAVDVPSTTRSCAGLLNISNVAAALCTFIVGGTNNAGDYSCPAGKFGFQFLKGFGFAGSFAAASFRVSVEDLAWPF